MLFLQAKFVKGKKILYKNYFVFFTLTRGRINVDYFLCVIEGVPLKPV